MTIEVSSPFPEWALPQLWAWIESFRDRVMDDFAPQTLEDFIADWEAQLASRKSWGVYVTGASAKQLAGVVVVRPLNPVAVDTHFVFKRAFWGHDITVPALRQVYREVFDAGVERISSAVFEDNAQLKQLAFAIGAVEETPPKRPLQRCTRRNGELVGMRIVSLFRDRFEQADEAQIAA